MTDAASNDFAAYRAQRARFIAACTRAGVDVIGRVHPRKGPDGKPLFMDSVALGPRDGRRGVLVIARGPAGLRLVTEAVAAGPRPPADGRLVLVHGADPAALAGIADDGRWPREMLQALAGEDLRKVERLTVMAEGDGEAVRAALAARLPRILINMAEWPADLAALRRGISVAFPASTQ